MNNVVAGIGIGVLLCAHSEIGILYGMGIIAFAAINGLADIYGDNG